MNKKSFFCGVFVGVLLTWVLSFYLYYSLNQSQSPKLTNSRSTNVFNFDDSEQSEEDYKDQKHSNLIGVESDNKEEGKLSYFKHKLKKEKEKRKLSQKLVDELRPVTVKQLEEFGIIRSLDDQYVRDEGYKTHAFNVLVSNHIGSYRDIPDTRHKM